MQTIEDLILENLDELVDLVSKDAIRQIPSYMEAPLRTTIERVENWFGVIATSLHKNDPKLLEQYLVVVAHERHAEGYQVSELHSVIQVTETHLRQLIEREVQEQVTRNALNALCDAVLGAARMVVSVTYIMIELGKT